MRHQSPPLSFAVLLTLCAAACSSKSPSDNASPDGSAPSGADGGNGATKDGSSGGGGDAGSGGGDGGGAMPDGSLGGPDGGPPSGGDGGGGEPAKRGVIQLNVKASNAGQNGSTHAANAAERRMPEGRIQPEDSTVLTPALFYNSMIASGPPDSLAIKIYSISLSGTGSNGPINVPIFADDAGASIGIVGSRVDLSAMFTTFQCVDNHGNAVTLDAGASCACGFDQDNNPIAPVTVGVSVLSPPPSSDAGTDAAGDGSSDAAGDASDGSSDAGGGDAAILTVCPQDLPDSSVIPGPGGQVATLEAEVGDYTQLNVVFGTEATVSGCVSANFNPGIGNAIVGAATYCTQTAYALDNGGADASADFPSSGPEPMDFALVSGSGTDGGDPGSTFTLTFPLATDFSLDAGATTPLTMVVDTNRLLRFYAHENARGNPAVMTAPTTISYFFSSTFPDSVYIFAGLPGNIYGYQWVAAACVNEDGGVPPISLPGLYDCTTDNDHGIPIENVGIIAGWLTMVTDSNGVPFMGNAEPDDDNALTVIKGDNQYSMSSGHTGWNAGAIVPADDAGDYNWTYNLGGTGTIYGIPLGAPVSDTPIPSVRFQGFETGWFPSTGAPTNEPSYGIVTVVRKL